MMLLLLMSIMLGEDSCKRIRAGESERSNRYASLSRRKTLIPGNQKQTSDRDTTVVGPFFAALSVFFGLASMRGESGKPLTIFWP